jgi:hypothetical protein
LHRIGRGMDVVRLYSLMIERGVFSQTVLVRNCG